VKFVRERIQLHAVIVSREDARMKPDIWLVRHGPTEWSEQGRHTGRTDIPLTAAGVVAASAILTVLAAHDFALVLASPMTRARETARLAGFPHPELDADLMEWDYGETEGLTTRQVRERGGEWSDWTVWTGRMPGGETVEQLGVRAGRVLDRVDGVAGDVLLFGHGHQLRILTAVALGLGPAAGARFMLDPATVSVIGTEHEVRALRVWNRGIDPAA
jgi:probable phosphoglycerate mutase